jgi:hypothetical protein
MHKALHVLWLHQDMRSEHGPTAGSSMLPHTLVGAFARCTPQTGLYKEGQPDGVLEIHHHLNPSFSTLFRVSKLAQAYSACCLVGIHGPSLP